MKIKITYTSFLFAICLTETLFFTSCYDFESEPLNVNSEKRVLNPGDSTENSSVKQLFYACYLHLPSLHNRIGNSYLDAATDDALPTSETTSLDYWRKGLISAGNIPDAGAWDDGYKGIRKVNLFLSKVDIFPPSSQVPANKILEMKAEARLLRAYYYFEMLKRWGGVPILYDRVLSASDNLNIPRNTIVEVANYITNEISPDVDGSCYNDLHPAQSTVDDLDPDNMGNMIGHVNQGVALGLLSRLHLYLASDLYVTESDDSGERLAKWQKAAYYAKKLIDLGVYDIFDNQSFPAKQFIFLNGDDFPNKEIIMVKVSGSATTSVETSNSPIGFSFQSNDGTLVTTSGATSPSQNLVDAFLTADGKSIYKNYDPNQGLDFEAGYDTQTPYANRDPRLNRFIFCNGSRWLNQIVETYDGGRHRGALQGTTYTRTGYYLKKFSAPNEAQNIFETSFHHYQIIRYAEILLNYAEAVNESDPSNHTEIEKGLLALRKRGGIKPGADDRYGLPIAYSQELMRQIIRNERRIELCFEEHRFWDIRRWKIAEDVLNKPIKGVRITKEGTALTYTYENVATSTFNADMMYWYPIPREELYGNKALKQNPNWSY